MLRDQRPPHRATLTLAIAVFLLGTIGLASPAHAQDVEAYLALARQYAAGQGDVAVERLAAWPDLALFPAASVATQTASTRDLLAAAMLHTELANTVIDTKPEIGRLHVNLAGNALAAASAHVGQRTRLAPFVRRWYRFVSSVYTSCELLDAAANTVQRGLDLFPDAAELFVARGVILEVSVRKTLLPDWRRDTIFGAANRGPIEDRLHTAAEQFRRALSIDGHNAEAHLHLGWVQFFLADAAARASLEAALADAEDDGVRYLAHLWLGGLAEREQRLDEALREFDAARASGSEYQTPYVAMSRVEQALGHDDRARALALLGLQLDKRDGDDPWWDHRIGFDRESLYWLRDAIRRPQ